METNYELGAPICRPQDVVVWIHSQVGASVSRRCDRAIVGHSRSRWRTLISRQLENGSELVLPVVIFELPGQVGLGQVAEVPVGERVELVLETAREHPLSGT